MVASQGTPKGFPDGAKMVQVGINMAPFLVHFASRGASFGAFGGQAGSRTAWRKSPRRILSHFGFLHGPQNASQNRSFLVSFFDAFLGAFLMPFWDACWRAFLLRKSIQTYITIRLHFSSAAGSENTSQELVQGMAGQTFKNHGFPWVLQGFRSMWRPLGGL